MPLRGTRVIHERWSEHHRQTAQGGMTATGTLTRAGTGPSVPNEDTGQIERPAAVTIIRDQVCRVQALATSDRIVEVGDSVVTLHSYLVAIPPDTPAAHVDDVWTVTACHADPSLVGRELKVTGITYGSEVWQRDLICQDNMGADHV